MNELVLRPNFDLNDPNPVACACLGGFRYLRLNEWVKAIVPMGQLKQIWQAKNAVKVLTATALAGNLWSNLQFLNELCGS
jgi:hypothetical protein